MHQLVVFTDSKFLSSAGSHTPTNRAGTAFHATPLRGIWSQQSRWKSSFTRQQADRLQTACVLTKPGGFYSCVVAKEAPAAARQPLALYAVWCRTAGKEQPAMKKASFTSSSRVRT